ncbi:hypothetical protein EJ05DRAFT_151861 [Pseudovirgaria hyperparasitica]|uniref:Uncharacterized protein n=1 Tax=Pseudovirgaria hyperparasitica TaxID=470096 RepID=A0A6A6VY26_9PEZI|nr:uncharacterized protein EJ05DRAFT_151861 [Pseudovirgaria hyperparasitica]KAF2754187.1 hypothetical protein EJ05DRAFT_151861 [Pseudovirgaria hyperparasitica]
MPREAPKVSNWTSHQPPEQCGDDPVFVLGSNGKFGRCRYVDIPALHELSLAKWNVQPLASPAFTPNNRTLMFLDPLASGYHSGEQNIQECRSTKSTRVLRKTRAELVDRSIHPTSLATTSGSLFDANVLSRSSKQELLAWGNNTIFSQKGISRRTIGRSQPALTYSAATGCGAASLCDVRCLSSSFRRSRRSLWTLKPREQVPRVRFEHWVCTNDSASHNDST